MCPVGTETASCSKSSKLAPTTGSAKTNRPQITSELKQVQNQELVGVSVEPSDVLEVTMPYPNLRVLTSEQIGSLEMLMAEKC